MFYESFGDMVLMFLPLRERLQLATANINWRECLNGTGMWTHIKFAADHDIKGMHLQTTDLRKISGVTKSRLQAARKVELMFSTGFHGLPAGFAAMSFPFVDTVYLLPSTDIAGVKILELPDVVGAISSLAPLRGATTLIMGMISNGQPDIVRAVIGQQGFKLAQAFPFMHTFVTDVNANEWEYCAPFCFWQLGISPERFCVLGWAAKEGLPALPNIQSLGIQESCLDEEDLQDLFCCLARNSPLLTFLALSMDSTIFKNSKWWYVFGSLPYGLLDLLLEFDSCDFGSEVHDLQILHWCISCVLPANTRLHLLAADRELPDCCDLITRQFEASAFISGSGSQRHFN